MAKTDTPKAIYLKDYRPHPYKVEKVNLEFDLDPTKTIITTTLNIIANTDNETADCELVGDNLKLLKVFVNDKELEQGEYRINDSSLTITAPGKSFVLKTIVEINPKGNTALEGLYLSDGTFCTQCEPEGFRRITYFIDRPDNMAIYTTKINADKKLYPILLSNGNKVDSCDLEDGGHSVTWKDPFPKPSYLYALVAGDLGLVSDTYTTGSGRKVDLEIYVDKGNEDQCGHAMLSLKNSMKWDEEVYGLEYDLDIYMIVAVDAFNMGAMENKGLNIFNSQYVLAKPETATDTNFEGVEGVIGHEYFHNWSGNRVTCRDWFQLTLKEGLTVFRDQEFSSDMTNRAVKRIMDVKHLKDAQFREDAGPMSHPIKPKSYIEMNNFYTLTVYEKGAEVIRMVHTLLGPETYRKATDKYFELFDGKAVTTEDFIHAMELASGRDLTQFKLWYDQNGTPTVKANTSYEGDKLTLSLEQSLIDSPNNNEIEALHIPLKLAFYSKTGEQLIVTDEKGKNANEFLLEFRNKSESFTFTGLKEKPVVSLNRGFTAPIILEFEQSTEELATLMAFDTDYYNKWNAIQAMMTVELNQLKGDVSNLSDTFTSSFGKLLENTSDDPYFYGFALALPSQSQLNNDLKICDFDNINNAHKKLTQLIGSKFYDQFEKVYKSINLTEYRVDSKDVGLRKLKNICLKYMTASTKEAALAEVDSSYENATNMTDELNGLSLIINYDHSDNKQKACEKFITKWKDEFLVVNKWFAAQASWEDERCLDLVKELEGHKLFRKDNPNMLRSLYRMFGTNVVAFNRADGEGYKYMVDKILEVDKINPQVASRLATTFSMIKKVDSNRSELMKKQLKRILDCSDTSKDTFEIVSKYLN